MPSICCCTICCGSAPPILAVLSTIPVTLPFHPSFQEKEAEPLLSTRAAVRPLTLLTPALTLLERPTHAFCLLAGLGERLYAVAPVPAPRTCSPLSHTSQLPQLSILVVVVNLERASNRLAPLTLTILPAHLAKHPCPAVLFSPTRPQKFCAPFTTHPPPASSLAFSPLHPFTPPPKPHCEISSRQQCRRSLRCCTTPPDAAERASDATTHAQQVPPCPTHKHTRCRHAHPLTFMGCPPSSASTLPVPSHAHPAHASCTLTLPVIQFVPPDLVTAILLRSVFTPFLLSPPQNRNTFGLHVGPDPPLRLGYPPTGRASTQPPAQLLPPLQSSSLPAPPIKPPGPKPTS